MKKLIFLLCFLPFILNGQRNVEVWWFDAGLKVQTGFTGIYNTAIIDHPNWNYDLSRGTSFGGKFGMNYDKNGIVLDVMFGSAQSLFENTTDNMSLDLTWDFLDYYLMWRNNQNLGYFELGPKMSTIRKVTSQAGEAGSPENDISDAFQGQSFAGVLGFGVYLIGSDGAFSGIFGFRFEYGFQDFVNAQGLAAGHPIAGSDIYSSGDSASNPIFAGITFELNWGIGYFGRASCGQRSKFIMF